MGDLLGSPCVAPLFPFSGRNFFHIYIYIYGIYLIYVHISQLGVVQRRGSNSGWDPGELVRPIGGESRELASGWDRRASRRACANGL